jgi:AbrB family looped-hinge helix DNA binding protein
MNTAVVTLKGQIVIPSVIRRQYGIKQGTKLCVFGKNEQIILQPLTNNYFEKMAGILKTKGKLSKAILDERAKDKKREEKND